MIVSIHDSNLLYRISWLKADSTCHVCSDIVVYCLLMCALQLPRYVRELGTSTSTIVWGCRVCCVGVCVCCVGVCLHVLCGGVVWGVGVCVWGVVWVGVCVHVLCGGELCGRGCVVCGGAVDGWVSVCMCCV